MKKGQQLALRGNYIGELRRGLSLWIAALAIAFGFLGAFVSTNAGSAAGGGWYRVPLEHGETHGYRWGTSAQGPKHQPLGRICEVVGSVAPINPEVGYVEAAETKSCGKLSKPTDSVSISVTLGTSEPNVTTLVATLYRPVIREVTFVLDTGERRVYRTRAVKVAKRTAKGIPVFRYLVARFDGGTCFRRIITSDPQGRVIKNEKAEPTCP